MQSALAQHEAFCADGDFARVALVELVDGDAEDSGDVFAGVAVFSDEVVFG